jgi:hypothetical protein
MLQEGPWGDDDRGPVPLKGKEPTIARDDVIGSRLGGGFEETVIGFVAKDAQTLSGFDQHGYLADEANNFLGVGSPKPAS